MKEREGRIPCPTQEYNALCSSGGLLSGVEYRRHERSHWLQFLSKGMNELEEVEHTGF